ncbi:Aquaporin-8 [Varanus komodoensis]|nr:Aquaporin-8 [Varanus komodoensis]
MAPGNVGIAPPQQHPAAAPTHGFSFLPFAFSGGHYNPAVSLGAWLVGGLNMVLVIPYWISQLCGGLIGAGFAKVVSAQEMYRNTTGAAFTTIKSDDQLLAAVVGEILMTMFLVMAVCMGAINEKTRSPLAPFCIGFTVAADILAG